MNGSALHVQAAVNEALADKSASNEGGGDPRQDLSELLSLEQALRVARAQLWRQSVQHLSIQESERQRIARDLHDGLGQTLSLVKLTIEDAGKSVSASENPKLKNTLERLSSQVKSALADLRRIAMNLRPSSLDDLGIVATITWYSREFAAGSPDIELECDICVQEADVPVSLKIPIYRIVQEATSNALKHAKADRIKVSLTSADGFLSLAIEDNGRGFDPRNAAGHRDFTHGIGLQSMQERAELSGGTYEFRSAPGNGTYIGVKWRSVADSDPQCPVIPMNRAAAQSMCRSAPDDNGLPGDFSVCLSCVRRDCGPHDAGCD